MKCSDLITVGLVGAVVGMTGVALMGCGNSAAQTNGVASGQARVEQKSNSSTQSIGEPGKGMTAIKQAAEAGKYLFVFFSKTDDAQTRSMREVFDKALEKVVDRAQGVAVTITDDSERDIVAKFDLSRAPMPLVLALAPNGAVTGGFATTFDEQELLDAFASPGAEKVMKSLQDGKLVFVCMQNGKTESNDAAMQGVRDFKSDARFAQATEIVVLDPSDQNEKSFLSELEVSPEIKAATTVFVAPPGNILGKFEGATNKDALVESLNKANTGCGPGGCGPGGCGAR